MSNEVEVLRIGKIEAAHRQLETAARLYFNSQDVVSIHTLVSAAHQILDDLAKQAGGKRMLASSLDSIGDPAVIAEVRKYMREPQNYFKHADREGAPEVKFSPGLSELMLIDGAGMLIQLSGEEPTMLRAFEKWFFMHHPEILKSLPGIHAIAVAAQRTFGTMSRAEFLSAFLKTSGEPSR